MDKAALYKLTYGLFVVGVKDTDKMNACVVNTAIQVTSSPARMSVTISKDNYTHDVLAKTKACTISILAQDVSMDIVGHFGFQSGRDVDKFAGRSFPADSRGIPYVQDGAVAWVSGNVTETLDVGTHTIFVLDIVEGEVLRKSEEPMTYAYYRQVKNGTVPKAAPTYREADTKETGWKCSVCGYVHPEETLPEDFTCPICRQPRSVFVKL